MVCCTGISIRNEDAAHIMGLVDGIADSDDFYQEVLDNLHCAQNCSKLSLMQTSLIPSANLYIAL